MQAKVNSVQTYIEKLQYNFTGVNYFDIRKNRPMTRILETAREITRQALPIKCVEAVFLAAYLTQGLKDLERVPMSFKSQVDGNTYKHIVLAVKHNSKWGAVGLSRRRELYFKEMTYDSLGELFLEFKRSYERVFHTLKRVRVGLPMAHDAISGEPVCWSYLTTKCNDVIAAEKLMAEHGRTAHRLHEQWRVEMKKTAANGQKPPAPPTREGSSKRRGAAAADKERGDSDADSSEGERAAAPTAASAAASAVASATAAPAGAAKDLAEAADMSSADAAATPAARPSFLAV